MYKHLIDNDLQAGKEARRASWPEGDFIKKLDQVSLADEQRKSLGLRKGATITTGEVYVYVSGKTSATVGYVISGDDRNSQDWELLATEAPAEAE